MKADSGFARLVAGNLKTETFRLIDIGCSGGLPVGFRAFGDRLEALAFDGLAEEVERLAQAEENPLVRYVAGMIGLPDDHPLRLRIKDKGYWHDFSSGRYAYERHQHIRQAKAEGREPLPIDEFYPKEVLAQSWLTKPVDGYDLDYAATFTVYPATTAQQAPGPNGFIDLPAFLKGAGFEDADFVKMDIDGPDYEVLRSLTELLARPTLLGVALEVNFIGSHDANDHTFHNVDRLMREKGFQLFSLSVRTYSAGALPFPYLDAHPSMNMGGRPVQGDAVYVRDLASRHCLEMASGLSDEKLAKTAAILALFSTPDYAAEMLLVHRHRLERVIDVDAGLDLLAEEIQHNPPAKPYRDYVASFEAEDGYFFDIYSQRNNWMAQIIQTANEAPEKAERLKAAEADNAALTARLAEAEAETARVTALAREIQSSTVWRLTAPVRALFSRARR